MPANELDGGDIVAPAAVEDTPTVTASKRTAEDDIASDESKKPRVGATLTADDVKADAAAHKDGPSATADTIPEPRFEGTTKPVVAEDDDEDEDDEDEDDEEVAEGEGDDGDDSDDEISEDELAALQNEAGVADEEEAPASTGRRPTRTTRAAVDYKKADAELGAFEGDE